VKTSSEDNILTERKKSNVFLEKNDKELNLEEVSLIYPGKSFGELALINDNPRLASIIAKTECHLAVLGKKEFKLILSAVEKERIIKEMGEFYDIPLFANFTFNHKRFIYLNC
jgi:CRP-like cAMP-binding protein